MRKEILLILLAITLNVTGAFAQNNCLEFDGVDDYVTVPDDASFDFSSFTIEAWIYTETVSANKAIMGKSNFQWIPASTGFDLEIDGTQLYGSVWNATGSQFYLKAGTISLARWHHVAMTWTSGGSLTLFVDGINMGSQAATFSGTISNNGAFKIGVRPWLNDLSWNGKIDEVRIWNNLRTEDEIRRNMHRELPDPASETNLVAYYKLNSTSGTTATDSKGSNTGTLTNMSGNEWQTSPAMFGPKNCLDFDGVDDYIECGNDASLTEFDNFTMEAWVKLENSNNNQKILGKFRDWNNYYIMGVGSGRHYSQIEANGNIAEFASGSVPSNEWVHLAVTYAKGNGSANGSFCGYVNGEIVYERTDVADAAISVDNASYPFRIGLAPWDINSFKVDGQIDEVRIWSTARTASEIRENMMRTLNGNESGLAAYYTFDNTSGITLQDFSGNENDGALKNMDNADWESSLAFNTWLNTTSNNWSTPTNWSGGTVPNSSTSNVGIPDHYTDPNINNNIAANALVVCDDAELTFSSGENHTIHGSYFNIGTTNLEANTELTITGSLYVLEWSTVNIKPLAALTVDKNLDLDFLLGSGNLHIKSDATGSGSLIVKGTATGSVNTERYIEAATWGTWDDGWHFVSSPVANYDIATSNFVVETAVDYDFYAWSEPDNEWINFKTGDSPSFVEVNGSDDFELGHGYLVAYKAYSDKDFTGTINVSDVEITGLTITGTTANNRSWHLLGNPFNSALVWFSSWTTNGNISGTAKIWNRENKSYSTLSAGDPIPATNGFMVQASGGTGTLTIPKAQRVHRSTAFYKNSDYPIIKIKANNLDVPSAQESEFRFNPESTINWDQEFDSDFLPGYAPLFYSTIDDMPMALNSMPNLEETTAIPFTFIKNEGLNFSVEMYEHQNLELDVWLLDKELNKNQNLSENPIYTFTAFEQDNPDRFIVHFSPVGLAEIETISSPIQVYSNGKGINVINNNNLTGEITILNILGQQMDSFKLESNINQSHHADFPSGVYVVYVKTSAGQVYSEKVIVN